MTKQRKLYNTNNSADDLFLNKKERQDKGAFHTPSYLAIDMVKKLFPQYIKCKTKLEITEKFGDIGQKFVKEFKLIDPCCGTGNLLAAALNTYKWIEEEDIYGIDIDARAVEFCIKKFPHGHFQVGDCLKDDITDDDFWNKKWNERYEDQTGLFGKTYKQKLEKLKQE